MIYTVDEISRRISPVAEKYHLKAVYLFGSYARGEANESSDIDLVVVGREDFKPLDVFAIAEELHENSGKPVDVYEIREIKKDSPFYRQIMAESVTLQ